MTKSSSAPPRSSWKNRYPRRLFAALSGGMIAALLLTSCGEEQNAVDDPTNVLQSVNVQLGSDASVSSVASNNIFANSDSGKSESKDSRYETRDVVNDLPVRITTNYTTGDDQSGSNLKDLDGYSGKVHINLTVENLSVAPQEVSYDAGGTKHSKQALVGIPMSVSGSTELDGVSPNQVVGDATDPDNKADGTNGIVSSTKDGKTVVQWASILAPPSSGASTTMQLNLDAKDFHAPNFDVGVQPGFSNNLSTDGVLTSAFNNNDSTEMALLQRTMKLASETQQTLNDAGTQISDVRNNLDANSETLGKTASEDLSKSNQRLTDTMKGLSEQVDTLSGDLDQAAKDNKSAMTEQLSQTVKALDSMLGDTSGSAPAMDFSGETCNAQIPQPQGGSTVYSSLIQLSGFLQGYAKANEGCQKELSASLKTLVGPEKPNAENCKVGSLTCSLYSSSSVVTASLLGTVDESTKVIDSLQPEGVRKANESLGKVNANIGELEAALEKLPPGPINPDVAKALQDFDASNGRLKESTKDLSIDVDKLKKSLDEIHQTAVQARQEIGAAGDGAAANGTMQAQNKALAEQICALQDDGIAQDGKLSKEQVAQLLKYVNNGTCDKSAAAAAPPEPTASASPTENPTPTPSEASSQPSDKQPSNGSTSESPKSEESSDAPVTPTAQAQGQAVEVKPMVDTEPTVPEKPMDARLENQATQWDQIINETDPNSAQFIGGKIADFQDKIEAVKAQSDDVGDKREDLSLALSQGGAIGDQVGKLKGAVSGLKEQTGALSGDLDEIKETQTEVKESVKKAFKDTSDKTAQQISSMMDEQTRVISKQGQESSQAVVNSFGNSVAGLSNTATSVVGTANGTVEEQRKQLAGQGNALQTSVDQQTQGSLQGLNERTSAATRDLAGSSTLLANDMNDLLLDLGDRRVNGSGLLGAMATSSARAGSADYQLALAEQNAEGFANVRSQDIDGLQLRQAQFKASLDKLSTMKGFHLDEPNGVAVKSLYSFHIGEVEK
ncbi:hypothetical protein [Curtobacterium sp. S6]|uniref:hypothetical protein n=1 Tax=Curtobacterium sp. S6 TaxID=1479623 RepID=UPI0005633D10|nr:hypothetical protein [Curtobacterium sp. S6]